MLSDRQKELLGVAIQGVKQRRAQTAQAAMQMKHDAGKAVLAAKSKAPASGGSTKPKSRAAGGATTATRVPQEAITPYLTSTDLMDTSTMLGNAEAADRGARHSFQNTAADALVARGDIERSRVKAVSGANDDAAARGLYDSGIRAGNVGMANADAARGQQGVRDTVALAAQQQAQVRAAARTQLAQQLGIMAGRAAENGMALPVDPYNAAPGQGANVPGAATTRKTTTKPRTAMKRRGTGKAVLS